MSPSDDIGEAIRRAAEIIKNQPYPEPCRHVVSPRALMRPGVYVCMDCGMPVEIPSPLSERA